MREAGGAFRVGVALPGGADRLAQEDARGGVALVDDLEGGGVVEAEFGLGKGVGGVGVREAQDGVVDVAIDAGNAVSTRSVEEGVDAVSEDREAGRLTVSLRDVRSEFRRVNALGTEEFGGARSKQRIVDQRSHSPDKSGMVSHQMERGDQIEGAGSDRSRGIGQEAEEVLADVGPLGERGLCGQDGQGAGEFVGVVERE